MLASEFVEMLEKFGEDIPRNLTCPSRSSLSNLTVWPCCIPCTARAFSRFGGRLHTATKRSPAGLLRKRIDNPPFLDARCSVSITSAELGLPELAAFTIVRVSAVHEQHHRHPEVVCNRYLPCPG